MKNILLCFVLTLLTVLGLTLSACQSTQSGPPGPRLGIDVVMLDSKGVVGFARSAPFQDVSLFGFTVGGRVRVVDLTTGLVIWQGVVSGGEILMLAGGKDSHYAPDALLPFEATKAFAANELVNVNGTITNPEYNLRFEPETV
jgi:hypothetical protein